MSLIDRILSLLERLVGGSTTREPVLTIGMIVAALEALNATVVDLPSWAHVLSAVLVAMGGAHIARSQVSPVGKLEDEFPEDFPAE